MKTMNYSIIRCICALVLGVLLVAWPEAAIQIGRASCRERV